MLCLEAVPESARGIPTSRNCSPRSLQSEHAPTHTLPHPNTHMPQYTHTHTHHTHTPGSSPRVNSHPAAQSTHSRARTRGKSQGSWSKFSLTPRSVLSRLGLSQVRWGESPEVILTRPSHFPHALFSLTHTLWTSSDRISCLIPHFLPALRTRLFHSSRNRQPSVQCPLTPLSLALASP